MDQHAPRKFPFGTIDIDLIEFASRANGVLGIRDSGKSYTAGYFAEQLHRGGIPFTAFDVSGVWKWLRIAGKGKGLPIVVAGGRDGDLPLTPQSASTIVEAAMKAGVSLVVDLTASSFSKADWRRIVHASVVTMMDKNSDHGLRHVFIEEAPEFVPQKPTDGQTYAVVERLVRVGGNFGLGVTLIAQRAAEVSKAVLELCDNLFLHRQRGKNSLESLSKWLDIAEVDDAKAIIATLSSLPTGECWAWLQGDLHATRIKIPAKQTQHPDRRALQGQGEFHAKQAIDVGTFVEKMRANLGKIEAGRKASDPSELRKRIAELERELRAKPTITQTVKTDPKALANERAAGFAEGVAAMQNFVEPPLKGLREAIDSASRFLRDLGKPLPKELRHRPKKVDASDIPEAGEKWFAKARLVQPRNVEAFTLAPIPGINSDLSPPLQKIVDAILWWNELGVDRPSNPQIAFMAGYSHKSGTWATYLSKLRSSGLIDGLRLTSGGIAAANPPGVTPTSEAIREAVMRKIDAPLQRILKPLLDAYPDSMSYEEAGAAAGYSHASGTWATYLSKLRSLDLIGRDRMLRAQDWLFPGGH